MIPVTKPFMPPKEEYEKYLATIWQREWLTNNGPLVNELELSLQNHLDLEHLLFVSNGTVALQLAIRSLGLTGEIITTPFSFVATTSSIVWEGCKPVFVDIEPATLNIDPEKIEAHVTENTSAILATHVYGNPCNIEAIRRIADRHNLRVIYDAAHSFGVRYQGRSIFEYGDISICSLHATKIYHSIEGGLIIVKDPKLLKKIAYMRNFGFDGPERFAELGINGKNSEFHAAMGLVNLKYIDSIIKEREKLVAHYDKRLKEVRARRPFWNTNATNNHGYYPLVFENEDIMRRCLEKLNRNYIFPRRYFYPSLAQSLPYLEHKTLPITDDISRRVLCLPLYGSLSPEDIDLIGTLILSAQNS